MVSPLAETAAVDEFLGCMSVPFGFRRGLLYCVFFCLPILEHLLRYSSHLCGGSYGCPDEFLRDCVYGGFALAWENEPALLSKSLCERQAKRWPIKVCSGINYCV